MVDVRCRHLDNDLWAYVAEYARLKKMTRCKALEQIIMEHMKFISRERDLRRAENTSG